MLRIQVARDGEGVNVSTNAGQGSKVFFGPWLDLNSVPIILTVRP